MSNHFIPNSQFENNKLQIHRDCKTCVFNNTYTVQ